jgi:phosphoribosylanthranilate isomerase
MEATARPRVKVCCIGSIDEAWTAVRRGAAALGLVSEMPSGPGVIPDAAIVEIAAAMPPPIATFLLTCRQDVAAIVAQQRLLRTNTVQLCDRLTAGSYDELRAALPGVGLVQVVHVSGADAFDEAVRVAAHVDALLLDSGNQRLEVKELGGTGRVHDWATSRRIREAVDVPVFLAGGLRPDNVRAAIDEVGPFGLDLCTGVRTDGRLDAAKLDVFFSRIPLA